MTIEEFSHLSEVKQQIDHLAQLVNYLSGINNGYTSYELMVGVDAISKEILPIAIKALDSLRSEFNSYQKVNK